MINLYEYYNVPDTLDNYNRYFTGIVLITSQDLTRRSRQYDFSNILHIIKKSPKYAKLYARTIIQDRWLEAEPYIIKDPMYAFWYAYEVIHDRWPEAEPSIMTQPNFACAYARDIIKGRWPEAEPSILESAYCSCEYASYVLKTRWPEAEDIIIKDQQSAYRYLTYVLNGNDGRFEQAITGNIHLLNQHQQNLEGCYSSFS